MATPEQKTQRKQLVMILGTILAVLALLAYLGAREFSGKHEAADEGKPINPLTMSKTDEITLGLKAAPALIDQYKGVSTNPDQKALVMRVGSAIAGTEMVKAGGWKFQFQLLAEPDIIDAFALPGGQVFVTTGLLNRMHTEGEVAAVLAHQIAHVLNRDGMKKLAADAGAVGGLSGEEGMNLMATQLVGLRYTAEQEKSADALAVKLMGETGYSPNALLGFFKILGTAYYAGSQVEYFTTHPNSATRVKDIQAAITAVYPDGVPDSMSK